MYGNTSFIVKAINFEIILASTLIKEIGLQFSIKFRSLSFFSTSVITAFL